MPRPIGTLALSTAQPFNVLNYWQDHAVSGARFLTGGVFEYDIPHRQSVAILCMLYNIRCNPVHPLNGAFPGPYVPVRVIRGALVSHGTLMRLLAAEPGSSAELLFIFQCPSGTILLIPYLIVWDWRIQGQGQSLFHFFIVEKYYFIIVFNYFSISLLSVYRLVLRGWGLRTDKLHITLSQPCTANLF